MLASSGNQLIDAETTAAASQSRSANILTLEISGAQHDTVLLSPGKWNVGSGSSNQIVLNSDDIAARQFLIIVTEHRSVIKDWSTRALINGSPFDSAVLSDGDTVEVDDVRLAFRLAGSQDLISQLPYVSEPICSEEKTPATDNGVAVAQCEERNTVNETADGMLSFDNSADRLDELISRIETSLASEESEPSGLDSDADRPGIDVLSSQLQVGAEMWPSDVSSIVAASPSTGPDSELAKDRIDQELRQLEELRAAVQIEREQLLAKRELLIQESQQIDIQIAKAQQSEKFGTGDDENTALDEADVELQEQSSNAFGISVESEDGAVAAEREKLRHYLEEFESVDDAAGGQLEEVEVAVGVAQAVADNRVMNALRSRDDAVKQLDDLVLAATGRPQAPPGSESNSLFNATKNDQTRERSGSFAPVSDSASEADGHDHNQHDSVESLEDVKTAPDIESSVEQIGELIDEVEAESLADEELNGASANEPESISDVSDAEDLFELNEQSTNETAASDDADSCVSLFGNAAVEESEESIDASAPNVAALSQPDDAEDMLTLQSSDDYSIVEEPSAESSIEVDDSESELPLESEKAEVSPTNTEADSEHTEPNSQDAGLNFEKADAGAPSWFDSKLLTEGDSEVDSESNVDRAASGEVDSEDAADTETDASAGDLRQKLAEMFDLPTLSENSENTDSVSMDDSLETHLQQFRDEPPADEVTEVDSNVSLSPWPDAASSDTKIESEPGLDLDPSKVSETRSDSEFESETLDAFPAIVSDQSADNSATSATAFEPEGQVEEEDSISVYMERLLARNRQVTGGSAAPVEENSTVVTVEASKTEPGVRSINQNQSAEGTVEADSEPEKWLDETPRHRQNRDQVRAEVQVLRQIANQSARSAVATASRRDVRKQVIVKTTASMLALGSGVAALLLDISMPFGLVVLSIGIMFSIDLGLTIFRNWKQLRDLRKAAKALAAETSEFADAPEPVSK